MLDLNAYHNKMSDQSNRELERLLDQIGRNGETEHSVERRSIIESILRDRSAHGVVLEETIFFQ